MWTKEPPKLGLGPIRMRTRLGPKVTLVRYFAGTEEVVGSKVRYLCGRIWRRNFGRSEQSWFLEIYTSFMQSLPESRVTEQFDLDSIIVIWISCLFTIQAVVGAPWCASVWPITFSCLRVIITRLIALVEHFVLHSCSPAIGIRLFLLFFPCRPINLTDICAFTELFPLSQWR